MHRRVAIVSLAVCLLTSGCGTIRSERIAENVPLGVSKNDVIKKVGHPAIVRGAFSKDDGEKVEVWEYKVGRGKSFEKVFGEAAYTAFTIGSGGQVLVSAADTGRIWVYFVSDKFAGWTPAGDWARDTERMRQMRFNTRY
ncbi:MAG: hypothetical protein KBB52_06130 [Candidatus Omnitrophica bacterium]|nr:hypothetical protein [Candidatus Omnitrophota bacterium]